ncbi:non-ribosomal peptide synthetase [Vibrio nitrifigilis]|uniref:Amino acid adenylation domain-containing protein n=1 Tax=Vibrio nitrifigilis TaxID=2789781 RepID=A0ABS0GDB6_9VIBR|nr:non-ribosomal peptide synthetase [Vibrio nitrifigilis]MBF9000416.1 amino acid adenylation domain-containing protein [Vibrio nitrifigilis]
MADTSFDLESLSPEEMMALLEQLEQEGAQQEVVEQETAITAQHLDHYPLSLAQQRLWFLAQMGEASDSAYLIEGGIRLQGQLNEDALQNALNQVLIRHSALRTSIVMRGDQPMQQIDRQLREFPLSKVNLTREQALASSFHPQFDLAQGPLVAARLIQIESNEHWLQLAMHHIISDGWSMSVFTRDLNECYCALIEDRSPLLAPLDIEYGDVAFWQREFRQEALEEEANYWREQLSGIPTCLDLYTDFPRPEVQSYAGDALAIELNETLTQALKTLSNRHGCTLYMTLLASWSALLSRMSNQTDVVVGSPIAGRSQQETENLIGMFVNSQAMRVNFAEPVNTAQLLEQVKQTTLAAQEHQELPFEKVVELVAPERSMSHSPVFQVMFALQNLPDANVSLPGMTISEIAQEVTTAKFDLSLVVSEVDGQLKGQLSYASSLFTPQTAQRYLTYWQRLLAAMVEHSAAPVQSLDMLPSEEYQELIHHLNPALPDVMKSGLVQQRIEKIALNYSDSVAVITEEKELTYGELNAQANQLAQWLRSQGVTNDRRVALCFDRSCDWVVSMLAILKAGAGYVPIDPSYPADRIEFMLTDSAPDLLLTDGCVDLEPVTTQLAERLPIVNVCEQGALWANNSTKNLPENGQATTSLAYIIYTSGSTGKPKGVMVEHHNLLNLIDWHNQAFDVKAGMCTSAVAGLGFDAAVWEIWPALSAGACLTMPTLKVSKDPEALLNWWVDQPIEVGFLSTPLAELAFARGVQPPHLKVLLVGGDKLNRRAPENATYRLVNNYGPTETTVVATSGDVPRSEGVLHIGQPLINSRVYILDDFGNLAPRGVSGELYIAGAGVARGYRNRDDLTQERFLPDPFADQVGVRMYRSGDLVRWREDGTIEYLGRNDDQIKIRGFRIELGEIATVLQRQPHIEEAIVVAQGQQTKRLVAYFTVADHHQVDVEALRQELSDELPDYMIPAAFVELAVMPLTANGKVDRRALPKPDNSAFVHNQYHAPQGEVECQLADIWAQLLDVEQVGREDNFFELGGHSLMATQLASRVRSQMQCDLSLTALFANPQLKSLAASLTNQEQSSALSAPISRYEQEQAPLSLAQQRLWFLAQMEPESQAAYTIAGGIKLIGDLNVTALRSALNAIMKRHDSLRTHIAVQDGQPVQRVDNSIVEFPLLVVDQEDNAIFKPQFDLATGPLVTAQLARINHHEHRIQIAMHHIIADGWSMGVLINELTLAYQQAVQQQPISLAPLAIQYTDFALWQQQALTGDHLESQQAYWVNQLTGAPDCLTLPSDYPRPLEQRYNGANVLVNLDRQLTADLKALSQRQGATLFMTLMASWATLMGRLANQNDVVIGTPVAGRTRTEVEPLIGMFANTQAIRVDLDNNPTMAELITQVKETVIAAQANQDIPFEQVVEAVSPTRSLAHNPIFQVMFGLQNLPKSEFVLPGLQVSTLDTEQNSAQFDLSLMLNEENGELNGFLNFSTALFTASTLERYLAYWQRLLRAMVDNETDYRVDHSLILDDQERTQVLESFNQTERDYPTDTCIHHRIEQTAARYANDIAVVDKDKQLTFAELNAQANQLAHWLVQQGVRPDSRVGVSLDRSCELVVALVAILKAGGAYVPMDPGYPEDRLEYMVQDSRPVVLLTTSELRTRLGQVPSDVQIAYFEGALPWANEAATNLDPASLGLSARSLAYLIYTSGSTGKPKGVMNEHRGVVNRLSWMAEDYGFSRDDVILQKTPFSFDVSVWEFFCPLWVGATLVMAKPDGHKDPQYLRELIERRQVSILHFVPPMLQMFLEGCESGDCPSLRLMFCSGEALPAETIRRTYQTLPHIELHNLYGPTEAAVDVTQWHCPRNLAGDRVSIGSSVANTRMYVLDAQGQPAPVGVAGELFIGGVQVARGYLNRDELTAERFVRDPFVSDSDATMYRTGDVGRWLADGTIEYQGRNDDQVKIRGFRVELGEISSALKGCDAVLEAVVIAKGSSANKRLIGYFTSESTLSIEALKAEMGERLPEYMVPAALVQIAEMPLTPNGKMDRKALPEPSDDAFVRRDYAAPQGECETLLANLWAQLLDTHQVGRFDSFFELGGHSLLAIQLIEQLRQQGFELKIKALFSHPTLADVAATLQTKQQEVVIPDNQIPATCAHITPDLLPLVTLSQSQIDTIAKQVPGGMANIQDIYPLAPLQEGMLFHHLLEQGGDPYVSRFIQSFAQRESLDQFVAALNGVIARHDILRTSMAWEGLAEPVQVVWRNAELSVSELSLNGSSDAVEQIKHHFDPAVTRIDVARAPLVEAYRAFDQQNQRWLLCLLVHHLCNDHTTLELMIDEVMALLTGDHDRLTTPVPFRQFVAYNRLQQNETAQREYFTQQLADIDEPSAPFGLLEAKVGQQTQQHIELPAELAQQIRHLSQRHHLSSAALFHLAWGVVLRHAIGRDDVVFGTVLFGRMGQVEQADRALGMFLNTLPVRVSFDSSAPCNVLEAVNNIQQTLAQLMEFEHAPLSLAQQCSGITGKTPLFSSMVNYRYQTTGEAQQRDDIDVKVIFSEERTSYPVSVNINDHVGAGFSLDIHVENSIGCARVADMFIQAIKQLVVSLDAPITALQVLSDQERTQVLEGFNQTERDYPTDTCIHHRIEQTAARYANDIAVVDKDKQLTFAELNAQANQLAHWLVQQGVRPDSRVGVSLDRSCELVVALVAILKAGGAYVPMDPGYPEDRLEYMVQDSRPVVLLTTSELRTRLGQVPSDVQIAYFEGALPWANEAATNLDPASLGLSARSLAYLIYTSGSTGKPKGVMNEHRGVVNRLSWMAEDYGFSRDDVILQKTPFSFDVSVWEFFCPLWVGATLVMAKPEGHKDPQYLRELIERRQVSILHFVPPMLQMFLEGCEAGDCPSLRLMFCSGEALPAETIRRTYQMLPHIELHNLYGPTEAAVDVTQWHCPRDLAGDRVSIGSSVANTRMYVLDAQGQPAPVGVAGELFIGGVQVARGYLNRDELTAERFVRDPFVNDSDATMYRTGDVGRWLADGTIEYQGRNDDQVKIRGFRVELGEISSALKGCEAVLEAVVIAKGSSANKRLIGYFTSESDLSIEALKAEMGERLPEYMVPAALVQIAEMPLTPNGKMDRKALPEPAEDAFVRQQYVMPIGDMELTLAFLWQELLGITQVGRFDSFFELGGHSLLAVKLVNELHQRGIILDLATLFETPVLCELAETFTQRQQEQRSLTLSFRETGNQTPLFIVPEASGETLYGPLLTAHIDSDIPVYGLVAPDRSEPSLKTVQKVAEHYVRAIRQRQSHGPYRLVGWSFGGTMAYEIAAQLIGQDEQIEFLGILDRWAVLPSFEREYHQGVRFETIEQEIAFMSKEIVEYQVNHSEDCRVSAEDIRTLLTESERWQDHFCLAQKMAILPRDWNAEYFYNWLIHRRDLLHADYKVPTIPVSIDLFVAQQRPMEEQGIHDPYLAWDQVLPTDAIRVTPLSGEHQLLISQPCVAETGKAISDAIAKRRNQHEVQQTPSYDPVVKLQLGKVDCAQVFCIPGAGDNVFSFMDLAGQLGNDVSIFGLQPRGLWGKEAPHSSVAAAARFYCEAMHKHLNDQPLHIVGHSFGGWVALELVNQLEEMGIPVASLTIADSRVPQAHQMEYTDVAAMMKLISLFEMQGVELNLTAEILESLSFDERLRRVHQSLVANRIMPATSRINHLQGIFRVFSTNIRTSYWPERRPNTTIGLLLSEEASQQQQEGWLDWSPEIRVQQSTANHVKLLKAPFVQQLAKLIQL